MALVSDIEQFKHRAALHAMSYVRSQSAIGLGTGSTVKYVLDELGRRLADGRLHSIVGVPTSDQTTQLARRLRIPLTSPEEQPELDLAIDGADEIDPNMNLIKGLGGALLREKIVAAAANLLIIVADSSKMVPQLGSRNPLPIEVIPFAAPLVLRRLADLPGKATIRYIANQQPFITDEGNYIIDYASGPIDDLEYLDTTLLRIPGVVEHGLFLNMTRCAAVADSQTVKIIEH
ncbi:MAG: ribose-5-phosphate isomerase RpiA [Chloroflexaceae bacterium]